jgi:hypothetical protein
MAGIIERPAKRIRCKYRDQTLYAILTFNEEGEPHAIQFSISNEDINQDTRTLSNIDALARMVSLNLREFELEFVVVNLLENSRTPGDLAAIIADILLTYGDLNVYETQSDVGAVGVSIGEECKSGTPKEVCG